MRSSKTPTATPSSSPAAEPLDEFGEIARLFLPLTRGAPEALGLKDDAAAIPLGGGETLVVSADTVVEGVHAPAGEDPALIARKLLRANLSDLAAKGAAAYGWLLSVAWPSGYDQGARARFAAGLKVDTEAFALRLLGGDTVRTEGPLVATAVVLGKTPRFVPRDGARPGDVLLVSGAVGDATLGLEEALGRPLSELEPGQRRALLERYRLPTPRLALAAALRAHASAAADVSDGLLADAGRIALASDLRAEIDLGRIPLSPAAAAWVAAQPDRAEALCRLAAGGDDYEVVCTCAPAEEARLVAAAEAAGAPLTPIGRCTAGEGVAALLDGAPITPPRLGYTHR